MSEFVFLFRSNGMAAPPETMEKIMPKWMSWMKELQDNGYLKAGRPLERSGKLVTGKSRTVTDGPHVESKDLIGGFVIIEANDMNHAIEISHGCPALDNDGCVEIRPVMKLDM